MNISLAGVSSPVGPQLPAIHTATLSLSCGGILAKCKKDPAEF